MVLDMMRAIHLLGALLAMGLTWTLAALVLVQWLFSDPISDGALLTIVAICFALAVYPAWRLFVQRRA
jgi:ABC-type antimicrobial peptide transport system permease subunit